MEEKQTGLFERIPEEKRRRILDTAVLEFASRGYAAANTNTIADRAGISVGSLFKYFPTKEELYLTLVNYAADRLEETLTPLLEAPGDVFSRIDSIIGVILENPAPELTLLYQRFTVEADEELATKVAERIESITALVYADLLARAQREGTVTDEIDPRVLAFCVDNIFLALQFSRCSGYYRRRMKLYLGTADEEGPDELRRQIMLFLRRALCR